MNVTNNLSFPAPSDAEFARLSARVRSGLDDLVAGHSKPMTRKFPSLDRFDGPDVEHVHSFTTEYHGKITTTTYCNKITAKGGKVETGKFYTDTGTGRRRGVKRSHQP